MKKVTSSTFKKYMAIKVGFISTHYPDGLTVVYKKIIGGAFGYQVYLTKGVY